MFNNLKAKIRAFPQAEDGQSALFAAMTIFCLFVTVGVMIGVGEVTVAQMRVQNAADAAAYSGAAVQADCLAQIAWINEGMSEIYYQSVKAAADSVAAYTQFMLTRAPANPFWDPSRVPNGEGGNLPPVPALKTALQVTPAMAQSAYDRAQELNNPDNGKAVEWLARLAIIQRTIAITAPDLVRHQVCHSAQVNFYDDRNKDGVSDETARVAMFPEDFSFYPENMDRHDVVIEKIGPLNPEPWAPNGWHMYSNTDPGYVFDAQQTMHTETAQAIINEWDFNLQYPGEDGQVTQQLTYRDEYYKKPVPEGCDGKCKSKHSQKIAYYEMRSTSHNYELLVTVYDDDGDGKPDAVVKKESKEGKRITQCIEPLENGVAIDGQSYVWDEEGYLSKNGKRVNETTSVMVNGVQVPASTPTWLGNVKLGSYPIEFTFDRFHCVLNGTRLDIHINLFPAGPAMVKQNDAAIHWLHTSTADGKWHEKGYHYNQNHEGKDRKYHRMKVVIPEKEWLYETITIGSYLTDMSWRKMFTRAAARNGALPAGQRYVPTSAGIMGGDPLDREEEDLGAADDAVWKENPAGNSPWPQYPEWMRPARIPQSSAAAQLDFGGFMDIDSGHPRACDTENDNYAFSATAPAVYPRPSKYTKNAVQAMPRLARLVSWNGREAEMNANSAVNPLFRLYFPPDANLADNDFCAANNIPDYIDSAGNPFPGYWIEGGFMRRADMSEEERNSGIVSLEDRLQDYAKGYTGKPWRLDPEDPQTTVYFPCMAFPRYTDGRQLWYLLVFDPLGAVPLFRQEPCYYNNCTAFYDFPDRRMRLGNDADIQTIAATPTRVRRTLGAYVGGYQTGSVREYLINTGKISDEKGKDWMVAAGMALDIEAMTPGLEVMSELFRRPLVVGVHAPATFGWLASLFGANRDKIDTKSRNLGLGNPLYVIDGDTTLSGHIRGGDINGKKWSSGHFAFSAARLFFVSPDGSMITNFAFGDAGTEFNTAHRDRLNLVKQKLSGSEQKWQKSTYNLFEPTWDASLVPLNASVRIDDLYCDLGEDDFSADDTPASYLFRQMQRLVWRRNMATTGVGNLYNDYRVNVNKITAPPMQRGAEGRSLHWGGELEDIVRH